MKNRETLTQQQQTDFGHAEDNAHLANQAFDQRREAAIAHKPQAFEKAERDFTTYQRMASLLMPPREVFEAAETPAAYSFAAPEVWSAMRPEQRRFAIDACEAIAAGPLAEYGVNWSTLRVISYETDDKEAHLALIHTGPGIDIGNPKKDFDPARSYNAVMSPDNDKLFQFELNGRTYDTRQGMTDPAYAAKVEDARNR